MKSIQQAVGILLISGIALASTAHKSFCQSLQVSYLIHLLILKRKITLSTKIIYDYNHLYSSLLQS